MTSERIEERHRRLQVRERARELPRALELLEDDMKIYGHPWSIHTRKVLLVLAEKRAEAEFVLVMIPKGEQKSAAHVALHPFAKVPVLEDAGFVLYEAHAINRYLDRRLSGPALVPTEERSAARMTQWLSAGASYLSPHAGLFLVETLFRRYLGGESNQSALDSAREGMQPALDVADRALEATPYLAGDAFSLADVHWLPYLDYLERTGNEALAGRQHLRAWFERVAGRESWQKVARSGPQPYEPGMTADVIEKRYR
jgi:glutathione S-transferase